jgi:hypothetical protein
MFLLALGVLGHWIGRSFRLFLVSLLVFSGCWAEEDVTLSHVGAIAGKHWDIVNDVAVDQQGFVYLVGESWSDFIWLGGERQTAGRRGASDAFVVKINPKDKRVVYLAFLGGRGEDRGTALVVDNEGAVYLVGETKSQDFPSTGKMSLRQGGSDAFVAKLRPDGAQFDFVRIWGGRGQDRAEDLTLCGRHSVCVVGTTDSSDFPVKKSKQKVVAGQQDAFMMRVSRQQGHVFSSVLFGGSDIDQGQAITVDNRGDILFSGVTHSYDLPTSVVQQRPLTDSDVFVAKISLQDHQPQTVSLIGGLGEDSVAAIVVDQQNNACVAGSTEATDWPVNAKAWQENNAGGRDAFVACLDQQGVLLRMSYLGGSHSDQARDLLIDPAGHLWLVGETNSSDFPRTTSSSVGGEAGDSDAFVSRLSASLEQLLFSSLIGGKRGDSLHAVSWLGTQSVIAAGYSWSKDFPYSEIAVPVSDNWNGFWAEWKTSELLSLPDLLPETQKMAFFLDEDTALEEKLRFDSRFPESLQSFQLVQEPSSGSLSLDVQTGQFRYHPYANFFGQDEFRYQLNIQGKSSKAAVVMLTIKGINDPPEAVDEEVSARVNQSVLIDVLANDRDVDNDVLAVNAFVDGFYGLVSRTGGQLIYTPKADFSGTDRLRYTITDGQLDGDAPATVTVRVHRPLEKVRGEQVTTTENKTVRVDILSNDLLGRQLSLKTFAQAKHGVVAREGRDLTYQPEVGFTGEDSFTYVLQDDHANEASGLVQVEVTKPLQGNTQYVFPSSQSARSVSITTLISGGKPPYRVYWAFGDGEKNEEETKDYALQTRHTYATDGAYQLLTTVVDQLDQRLSFVTLVLVPSLTAQHAVWEIEEDTLFSARLLALSEYASPIEYRLGNMPAVGILTLDDAVTGQVTYQPDNNWNGELSFSFQALQQNRLSSPGEITLLVKAVNDKPVAEDDFIETTANQAVSIDQVLDNDKDPDKDTLRIFSVTQGKNGSVLLLSDNRLRYTPDNGFSGEDSFDYEVSDSLGGMSKARVHIEVKLGSLVTD